MVTLDNGADSGPEPPEQLLWNIKTVILKTGLSRPSIYRYMKRGRFPPRRRVGPNRVAWVPAEVVAWIEGCPRLDQRHDRPNDNPATEHHQVAARLPSEGFG
jgi:predicted DNA-binding transcriptional regulator AlpA